MPVPLDVAQHWSRRRILFILANIDSFRAGIIPNYKTTGYTSAEHTQRQIRAMGYFVPAVEMAAEATLRCDRAGNDGYIVRCIYEDCPDPRAQQKEAQKLARVLGYPHEGFIWRRVSRALRYASSDDCLLVDYKKWRRLNKK